MARYSYLIVPILLCSAALAGCQDKGQPLVPLDTSTPVENTTTNVTPQTTNPVTTPTGSTNTSPTQTSSTPVSPSVASNSENSTTLIPLDQLPREKALIITTLNPGLVDFDQKKFDNLKGSNPIALFFSSKACQSCALLVKKIKEDKLYLPGGLVVFKLDADKEKALATTYGVKAGQMVILDAKGAIFSVNSLEDQASLGISMRKVMEL